MLNHKHFGVFVLFRFRTTLGDQGLFLPLCTEELGLGSIGRVDSVQKKVISEFS